MRGDITGEVTCRLTEYVEQQSVAELIPVASVRAALEAEARQKQAAAAEAARQAAAEAQAASAAAAAAQAAEAAAAAASQAEEPPAAPVIGPPGESQHNSLHTMHIVFFSQAAACLPFDFKCIPLPNIHVKPHTVKDWAGCTLLGRQHFSRSLIV